MTKVQEGVTQEQLRAPVAWKLLLLVGVATGIIWVGFIMGGNTLALFAGIVPVLSGMYIGRRISQRPILHGFLLGVIELLVGMAVATPLIFMAPQLVNAAEKPVESQAEKTALLLTIGGTGLVMLLPFPIYGVFISSRTRQRKEDMAAELAKRGGRLENPGRVTSVEDLQALSLAKFATYVIRLFKKNGFTLDDYSFSKDNYVDIVMKYQGEPWLLRCIVTTDRVKPGDVQQLVQRKMKDEQIGRGVVITSTDFVESARKWAANRAEVVTIDGATLIEMSERSGTPPEQS